MRRTPPLSLLLLGLLTATCSDSDDKAASAPQIPSDISAEAFSGECLSLEKVSAHIGNPGFSYPAHRYISDFKILSGNSKDRERLIYANNLFHQNVNLNGLGEFSGTTQAGCDTVSIPVSGSIAGIYKIIESGPRFLKLEYVPPSDPMIPGRPQGKKFVEAFKKFPLPSAYEISVPSGREIIVAARYELAPYSCDVNGPKIEVLTTEMVLWEDTAATLPTRAKLAVPFILKLNELFPQYFVEQAAALALAAQDGTTPPVVEVPFEQVDDFAKTASAGEVTCVPR